MQYKNLVADTLRELAKSSDPQILNKFIIELVKQAEKNYSTKFEILNIKS